MKKYILLSGLCILACVAVAQTGQWVWMNGDSAANNPGNYGVQGVASPSNQPPGFYEPCEWRDLNGNFWFYGGADKAFGTYNDLWKYDPVANEWTWMNGTHTIDDMGNYGVQGVPSPNNRPPARGWGTPTWTDENGDLWFFGGNNAGLRYEDLWRYNIASNEWTWMSGPGTYGGASSYGTMGVPNASNQPPYRDETSATWTVASGGAGDLWLFGGEYEYLYTMNDLWRFNIATNTWTWMNGSDLLNPTGIYGTRGVENSANTPGSRRIYCKWKDNNGNLWLFGGWDDYNGIYHNDLWRYDLATNNWAWINGSNIGNTIGNYGTKCVMSPSNTPGSRYEDRVSWTDKNGDFWMFGGGHDYFLDNIWSNVWNDLWKYCVASNEWIWVSGDTVSNLPARWGALGVANPANKPGGLAGAVGWYDRDPSYEHLYIFAGSDSSLNLYNSVWKYTIDSVCSVCSAAMPVVSFQSDDSAFCQFGCVNFTDLSRGATAWQWIFPGGIPSSSTEQNPQTICYTDTGSYDVTLIAYSGGGSDSLTIANYIKVYPSPPTPVISQVNIDTLHCTTDPSYVSYQWYLNDTLIAGATDTLLAISKSGNYNISVTDKNGCQIAVGINVILGVTDYYKDPVVLLYPNPVENKFTVYVLQFTVSVVTIYNVLGQEASPPTPLQGRGESASIDVSRLPSGIYFVEISGEKERWVGKFIKE